MNTATAVRIETERRLLAALFRWPRIVDLSFRDFVSPTHAVFFGALQEVQATWPVTFSNEPGYDDIGLTLMAWCLDRDHFMRLFRSVGGLRRFVVEELMQLGMLMPDDDDIAVMVEQVRACPRCGR